jgi:dCMP deaminase
MKSKFKKTYMDVAKRFAELSHARRLKVGCVIVKDDIMHPGFNGMPAGFDNDCEDKELMDKSAGGWLSPEEINEQWPYEGYFRDSDDNPIQWRYRLKTKPEVLHAESNAIAKMLKVGMNTLDADVFVTHAPCIDCAKILFQAGVRSVTFGEKYRDSTGINFLKKTGVIVEQFIE